MQKIIEYFVDIRLLDNIPSSHRKYGPNVILSMCLDYSTLLRRLHYSYDCVGKMYYKVQGTIVLADNHHAFFRSGEINLTDNELLNLSKEVIMFNDGISDKFNFRLSNKLLSEFLDG